MIDQIVQFGDLGLGAIVLFYLGPKIIKLETDVKHIKEEIKNGRS